MNLSSLLKANRKTASMRSNGSEESFILSKFDEIHENEARRQEHSGDVRSEQVRSIYVHPVL
jgi:hypothetical protein